MTVHIIPRRVAAMKIKVIIITMVLLLMGSAVLGLTALNLTQQEAVESAISNSLQTEIDVLNLELKQMTHDSNLKTARIPAANTYYGQLAKLYNPFVSETNLTVEKARQEMAYEQMMIDVTSAAITLESAALAYDEADASHAEAKKAYNDALNDPSYTSADRLSLEYTMESARITLLQSEASLRTAQMKLDNLVGQDNVSVQLPNEYSNPYDISEDDAYESALVTDISIYQSKRNAEAAEIKFEIAAKYYDEDEDTYISALAGLKTSQMAYDKALLSLKIRVLDDISSLKNKYDSIELAKLNKEMKQNDYTSAKSQFEAGVLSASSLEVTEDIYNSAVKQLDAKIHDYILTSMRFSLNYGYKY